MSLEKPRLAMIRASREHIGLNSYTVLAEMLDGSGINSSPVVSSEGSVELVGRILPLGSVEGLVVLNYDYDQSTPSPIDPTAVKEASAFSLAAPELPIFLPVEVPPETLGPIAVQAEIIVFGTKDIGIIRNRLGEK